MIDDYKSRLESIQNDVAQKANEVHKLVSDKLLVLQQIDVEIKKQERHLKNTANFVTRSISNRIDQTLFIDFLKKPYKIKQIDSKKYEIYIPKWVPDFQVGWLTEDDGIWFTYEVNQFSAWLGDIPEDIANKLDLGSDFKATVKGNQVQFNEDKKQEAEKLFKGHILKWNLDNATIKQGHEFDIILKIIRSGHIPFEPVPVLSNDTRKSETIFELRPYQKEALKKFHETGAIGVFHPTGAGKSFVAMEAMDEIPGKKILVTKKTLIDQWKFYFEKYSPRLLDEVTIVTYELLRSRTELLREFYSVAVFDECHRLPANSFAKLSLINCKYRIGLSASPHREDGNEGMIIALTGYPTGLNWPKYMKETKRKYHPINIHIVKQKHNKISKIRSLLDYSKKTIIFSDDLAMGNRLSSEFNVPFIQGSTENRKEVLDSNKIVVGSRVLDEGVSIPDLQRLIEVEFLYGSKQQEIQRTGRLMHSLKAERHDIVMTESEFEMYGKRIWILQEKGFHVKIEGGN